MIHLLVLPRIINQKKRHSSVKSAIQSAQQQHHGLAFKRNANWARCSLEGSTIIAISELIDAAL